jgi:hypothetical protein
MLSLPWRQWTNLILPQRLYLSHMQVAVKIIHERNGNEVEVFRNAVELAVLSTLSHPNIVQVRKA